VFAALTAGIGVAVLAGWFFGIESLKRFVPGLISMNPVTACCLIAAAVALCLLSPASPSRFRKRTGQMLASVVLAVGVLRLVSIWTTWQPGVDQWLFPTQLSDGVDPPSRIALRTAIALVLVGCSLLLLDFRTARGRRPTELLAAISAVIAFLALVGYSYGLFLYYRAPDFVPMSFPGTIAFLLLATGTLLARPKEGVMRIVTSDTPAGLLLRLLLPLSVIVPVLLGALRLGGENAGLYTTRIGVALFATAFIILFLASVGWTTRLLVRSDADRKAAEARARELNAELEARVADRTAKLNALNEELLQASKTKDNFLAALSHELRTPLTPVLMSAAALEHDVGLAPEYREQLAMMRRNVELEARLIDDLLDLTRSARGKLQLQLGPANVHALLRHTEDIVGRDASDKRVSLGLALEARDHNVAGDAARLHQVLWNVLKNAIKFTPAGGAIVVRTSNPGDGKVRVEIQDTGVGIEPELLPHIFAPFVQGEMGTGRELGGLGLGMSISKTIVELHGGTIRADSVGRGRGTTVTIDLNTASSVTTEDHSLAAPSARSPRTYRLLVVEDHQPTLDVLARLLGRQGHDVSTAGSVEAALELAGRGKFDLVISDIGLPDGNGVDLMVQLTRDYGLRGIALSGYGMDDDLARTRAAGFIAHLVKPIDFQRLNNVLEQLARAA
jgi:signal transduction histidine kinase